MADETNTATMAERVTDVVDRIRPLIQADGGDIQLIDVNEETGVVSIRFRGACVGCPSAAMTLKMGIERNLKERVPEVKEVVAVQ